MANFVALTPPLGQHGFAAFQSATFSPSQGIPLTYGVSIAEFSYPPLNAPIRALILKKYPGTILPDPDLEDVFPCADPDPIHIQEIWRKYDETLGDDHLYDDLPFVNLATFAEREIAEWVAEHQAKHGPTVFVIADRTIMGFMEPKEPRKLKSKKRSRGDAFKYDATIEKTEERAAKQIKNGSSSTAVTNQQPSMKEHYDKEYPAAVVVDHDSPAYVMSLNYLKAYVRSNGKHANDVTEIIAKHGMDFMAQRCAKFFAWGLKQAIYSIKVESAADTPKLAAAKPVDDVESEEEEDNSDYDELNLEDSDDEEEDEIINFKPLDQKPKFNFEKSSLGERLGSFISDIKGANDELKAGLQAGHNVSMELTDSEEEHVEMNLGLGVLEETRDEKEVLIEKA